MDRTALASLTLSLIGGITAAAEFRAQPAEATLRDAERTYPCVGVKPDWYPTHLVGRRRYRVDANSVTDVTEPDESKHRQASVPQDCRLRWAGAAEGIAFLVADRGVTELELDNPESHRRFCRLDLGSMKWLDPFKLPEPSIDRCQGKLLHFGGNASQEPRRHVLADHLLVTPIGIVALCEETIEQPSEFGLDVMQRHSVGFHVNCYAPTDVEAKWSRAVRCGSSTRRIVGFAMRSYDDSVQRLTYVPGSHDDDVILVCPGERNAVVCLAATDGKVCWRMPAIWEYERGFIGPSVFEHYIERFGLDYASVIDARNPVLYHGEDDIDRKELRERTRRKIQAGRKLAAARKAFYARYEGRITAGPIVVPDAGRGRAYLAAVRSLKPESGCAEQPEHAIVYEIDPSGDSAEITSMTRLPRAVIGWPHRAVPGGFVLSCDRGCLVRLRTYEHDFSRGFMGPGRMADDMVLQIDWYREYLMRCPSARFMADPPADVAGFSKVRLFRPGRAYVREMEDKVYHLQINVVDLRTGLDHDLTLSVPFAGELPIPETGLSSFNRGHSSERLTSHRPHAVWINHLCVNDGCLTAAVVHGSQCTALTFDLLAMLTDESASIVE
jgi:hypothetical protein